jgi:hypothetical protein
MTCGEAYQAILEADVPELDGSGTGALARHLDGCMSCRELAQMVIREEAALGEGLLDLLPPLDVDLLLGKATETPSKGRAKTEARVLGSSPLSMKRFRKLAVAAAPLAAAAAVGALILGREPQLPGPVYSPPERMAGLEVEVPQDRNVAVLETANPDITVLWLF